MSPPTEKERAFVISTPAQHRAAALDLLDRGSRTPESSPRRVGLLLEGLTHAVLALGEQPTPAPSGASSADAIKGNDYPLRPIRRTRTTPSRTADQKETPAA